MDPLECREVAPAFVASVRIHLERVLVAMGTDLYWARSRVVEYLATIQNKLPPGVTPHTGPDAPSIGWVYQYVLVDESGLHDLGELRTLHDFSLRYPSPLLPRFLLR